MSSLVATKRKSQKWPNRPNTKVSRLHLCLHIHFSFWRRLSPPSSWDPVSCQLSTHRVSMDSDQSCPAQSSLPMGSTGSLSHRVMQSGHMQKKYFFGGNKSSNCPIPSTETKDPLSRADLKLLWHSSRLKTAQTFEIPCAQTALPASPHTTTGNHFIAKLCKKIPCCMSQEMSQYAK